MDLATSTPRIHFDANSEFAPRTFIVVQGTIDDLRALGLTLEAAVGKRFTFVQEDSGPEGKPDALFFEGTIARGANNRYFSVADDQGVRWWSQVHGLGA